MTDNLTWQVSSLEYSKRLKELGVPQESLWYWVHYYSLGKMCWNLFPKDEHDIVNEHISAFTVAELGKQFLPIELDNNKVLQFGYGGKENPNKFWCQIIDVNNLVIEYGKEDDTEANARAKMLIYLLEKGLVKL